MRATFFPPYSLLAAFLVIHLVSGPQESRAEEASVQNQQEKIEAIESKLTKEKEKLEAFHYEEKGLLGVLSELEGEVAEKRLAVENLGSKIRGTEREIQRVEKQLKNLEAQSAELEARMAERLVILYKYARKGTFKVLVSAEDMNQLWRRATYLRAILEEDRDTMLALAEQQSSVREEISNLQNEIVRKKAAKNEEERHLAAVKQELDQKVIRLMKVHKEKEFYETAVNELESAAKELKQAVQRIEKRPTYEATPAGNLVDSKGRLPLPMEGRMIVSGEFSAAAGLQEGKGVLITNSSDSAVRAVFPGRVDFSGKLKGYGDVIIINHGSRYFSISAHLSERTKQEGEVVEGGEAIGWVRGGKGSSKVWLYFEMREGDRNLDVMKWLKRAEG